MTGKLTWLLAGALAIAGSGETLFAQTTSDPLRIRASATEITLSGRVQAQLNTSSVDGVAPTEAILRRVRFGVDFRINDFVSGRVHPELSGSSLSLGDAYGQLTFSPGARLQIGRFHRPFGTIEDQSSLRLPMIERGTRIRGVSDVELSGILSGLRYGDRDTGIQLLGAPEGAPLGLSYNLALFAGPLQGLSGDQLTHQLVGRVTIQPVDGLSLGAGVNHRQFVDPSEGGELDGGNAFVLNFELGGPTPEPGLHIIGEAATGAYSYLPEEDFSGVQVVASYLAPAGERLTLIEPLFRVSHGSIDRVGNSPLRGGTLFTPGINLYLGGLNRVMFNYDIWNPEVGETESSFKAQFQVTF